MTHAIHLSRACCAWALFAFAGILLFPPRAVAGTLTDAPRVDYHANVLLPDGSPAAGASVEAVDSDNDAVIVVASGIADTQGRVTLHLPAEICKSANCGCYLLRIRKDDYVGMSLAMDFAIRANTDGTVTGPSELTLSPACRVSGVLTDSDTGKPIAGATISVPMLDVVTTDRHGAFAFAPLPRISLPFLILKKGFARRVIKTNLNGQPQVKLAFTTRGEGIITGKVTDNQGHPLAHVSVSDQSSEYPHFVTTDAQGGYTLDGLEPDRAVSNLVVDLAGYQFGDAPLDKVAFPTHAHAVIANFTLIPIITRSVTGRVVHADGTPAKGVTVQYGWATYYSGMKKTTTDDDGRYRLPAVDDSKNLLVVQGEGIAPAFAFVHEKGDAEINVTVVPGHWLEGTVVDAQGSPLPSVRISLTACDVAAVKQLGFGGDDNLTFRYLAVGIKTDRDGHFRCDNLPAGEVLISLSKENYSMQEDQRVTTDAKHTITLLSQGVIVGKVVDSRGQPVPHYHLRLDAPEGWRAGEPTEMTWCVVGYQGEDITAVDGGFKLEHLTVGAAVKILITAPGYFHAAVNRVEIKTADEAALTPVSITLTPAAPFTGIITDAATGHGLAGAVVSVVDARWQNCLHWEADEEHYTDWHPVSTRTDVHGQFSFPSSPLRVGCIMLSCPSYGRRVLADVDCSKPLSESMASAATIDGVIDFQLKDTTVPIYVMLSTADGRQSFNSITLEGGKRAFTFSDLAAGDYLLTVDAGDKMLRTYFASLHAGEHYHVDWHRVGAAQLTGTIRLTCKDSEYAIIDLRPQPGGGLAWASANISADGSYQLVVPRIGKYSLSIRIQGDGQRVHYLATKMLKLTAGMNHLDLAFTGALSGQVVDAEHGTPMAKVQVRAYQLATESEKFGADSWRSWLAGFYPAARWWPEQTTVITDEQGRFVLDNLTPGEWCAALVTDKNASVDEGGPSSPTIHLAEGERRDDIVLRYPPTGCARITAIDAASGQTIPHVNLVCVDAKGMVFFPPRDQAGRQDSAAKSDDDGSVNFTELPIGQYTVYPVNRVPGLTGADGYIAAPKQFAIAAGQSTTVQIPLRANGSLIFRLNETEKTLRFAVLFKLTKHGTHDPVLTGPYGPCLGERLYFDAVDPARRSARVTLPSGKYDLFVGILNTDGRRQEYVWTKSTTVQVTAQTNVAVELAYPSEK